MKKRMLSGIKPSGQLHLGNYIGALRNFVKYQDDYEMVVFIANLHCITVPQDPQTLQKNLRDAAALYIAAGLDPKKSTIFLQSDVMAHSQLTFILQSNTGLGELNRMTQYKDKVAKGETDLSVGLYTYPTLMASDILVQDAHYVPVGIDQKQHVELTRDLAQRMNHRYHKDLFIVPEPVIEKVGSKIYSLQKVENKMSKSDTTVKDIIYLLDPVKVATKKIMSAVTDSENKIAYNPEKQPGISNLLTIAASLTYQDIETIVNECKHMQYGEFKRYVADIVGKTLSDLQEKYHEVLESNLLEDVLAQGAKKAQQTANNRLKIVQQTLGLEIIGETK